MSTNVSEPFKTLSRRSAPISAGLGLRVLYLVGTDETPFRYVRPSKSGMFSA
jgi:hypothetical protein